MRNLFRRLRRDQKGSTMASAAFVVMAGVMAIGFAAASTTTLSGYDANNRSQQIAQAADGAFAAYTSQLNAALAAGTTPPDTLPPIVDGDTTTTVNAPEAAGVRTVTITVTYKADTKTFTRKLSSADVGTTGTHITGYNADGAPMWRTETKTTERRFNVQTSKGISIGETHSCAISYSSADIYCWGKDGLGDNTAIGKTVPTKVDRSDVPAGRTFTQVVVDKTDNTAGGTCALDNTGAAWCWGPNGSQQLGVGSATTTILKPTAVTGGYAFSSLSMSGGTTCGVAADGTAYCWGLNNKGQVGDTTEIDKTAPTAVAAGIAPDPLFVPKFASVEVFGSKAAASYAACGVTIAVPAQIPANQYWCWGSLSTGLKYSQPNLMSGTLTVAAGSFDTTNLCVLTTTPNQGWCAGPSGTPSVVGQGGTAQGKAGFPLKQQTTAYTMTTNPGISVRGGAACMYSDAGQMCWGANSTGQLGNGTVVSTNATTVATVASDGKAEFQYSTGFSCMTNNHRAIKCWGLGTSGQLGNGTSVNASTPQTVTSTVKFAHVYVGEAGAVGVDWKGRLYSWGANTDGQAGTNSTAVVNTPTLVFDASTTTVPYTAYKSFN